MAAAAQGDRGGERRLANAVARGGVLTILVDGAELTAYEGETVAGALFAAGRRRLRTTPHLGEPRGVYCGMGVCFDCLVAIDGRPRQRACTTAVRPAMRIQTHENPADPRMPGTC